MYNNVLWNPDVLNLQGKWKFGSKNQIVREIRGKILQCSTEERETTFGSSYRKVKNEK